MTPQQLKNSILQMAMQGKLVEQRPEEGTGEELYQQIQKEKQKLIKEGKIKKEKPLPEITEEEIPFEIPESWKWVRLQQCGYFISGYTPKANELGKEGIPYFKVSDMNTRGNEKGLRKTELFVNPKYVHKSFDKGTIVYPKNGGAVFTNKRRVLIQKSVVDLNTGGFRPYECLCFDYIFTLFNSLDFRQYSKGTALPTLDMDRIVAIMTPLPPLAEQKRIVAKIEELMPFIDRYATAYNNLQSYNTRFPDDLKKSILQQAIQGKLVPQDPNDEPASELLKKIAKEKEKLIKEGKIKKQKPLPPIKDDEIPFDIPESWRWVRLANITSILGDGIHGTPEYDTSGEYYFINGNNLCNGKIIIKQDTKTINYNEYKKYKTELNENSVLVSINGTLGNIAYYNGEPIILGKSACYFNLIIEECKYYIYWILKTDYFNKYALASATGTTIKNVSLKAMRLLPIPLPPLAEQKRIVAKLDELLPQIDRLKEHRN